MSAVGVNELHALLHLSDLAFTELEGETVGNSSLIGNVRWLNRKHVGSCITDGNLCLPWQQHFRQATLAFAPLPLLAKLDRSDASIASELARSPPSASYYGDELMEKFFGDRVFRWHCREAQLAYVSSSPCRSFWADALA